MEIPETRPWTSKGFGHSRLNIVSATMAVALLAAAGTLQAQRVASPSHATGVDEANPLVGTAPLDRPDLIGNAPPAGEPLYSGMTSPGARLPHSATEAAPVNVNLDLSYPTGVPAPYHYPNPTLFGFTGGGGASYGGNGEPMIMPVVGDWTVSPAYTAAYYDKKRETASPGYYAVYLDTFRTQVELTATAQTSLMQFTFPESRRSNVIVNLRRNGGDVEVTGDRSIRGVASGRKNATSESRYFVAEFSKPFAGFGTFHADTSRQGWGIGEKDVQPGQRKTQGSYAGAYITFDTQAGEKVLMKIAHGHSYDEAEQRLRKESSDWDFARVHAQARAAWAQLFDRVQVTGGTPRQRMMFYSTLFQSFASPRLVARKGERFTDAGGKVQVATHDRYGPVPFWDTGRNQIVLMMLLEPRVVQDIMQSELDMAASVAT